MTTDALQSALLSSGTFQTLLANVSKRAILQDLPVVESETALEPVDWDFALLCCSALTSAVSEHGQDSALRIAQACLTADDSEDHHREAAALLLERMGNWPAVHLAEQRQLVQVDTWTDAPTPLLLDVIHRRLELTIPLANGKSIPANRFQREFWSAVEKARWISVSAPTSAGKSFIVRRWFEEALAGYSTVRAVYIVPTRALIEEVSMDLRDEFDREVAVFTLPWDAAIGTADKEIYVLTQERFHLLQQRFPDFAPDLVFVDEAQKFGDDSRGVLLQRVIDESVRRKGGAQVLFASPLSENPEFLLVGAPEGAATSALYSEVVTVNQNLLWANQVPRKPTLWTLQRIAPGQEDIVGQFELLARPSPESKRLPLVAVALGKDSPGNVVYVNGAAAAEKTASQIADALNGSDLSGDDDVTALRELIEKTIHKKYALTAVLKRGVAFHYGNMPLLVRNEIERLFRSGVLKYLVCTSTLLEGVNLPCRNLFARGPKKGNRRYMTPADFWNLAGRAGRWGKEFQGNIVCVDTSLERHWPMPPRERVTQPLTRATDGIMSDVGRLSSYIQDGTPVDKGRADPLLESVFSFLATRVADGSQLTSVPGISLDETVGADLQRDIEEALDVVELPVELWRKHAGVSPLSMQRLLHYFRSKEDQESLHLAAPESADAAESYVRALSRVSRFLGGNFGVAGRQWVLSILIVNWMRGSPLARLISERVAYYEGRGDTQNLSSIIRGTMQDVEQIARFEAPKYLACYVDVLRFHLETLGQEEAAEELPDISMMLELGVSRETELSLMTMGLSRASAVALSELIVADDLSVAQSVAWLRENDFEQLDLPVLVRREISTVLERFPLESET